MQYLRIKDVVEKTRLCKSHVWEQAKKGDFPSPINLSPRVTVWVEDEVEEWMLQQKENSQKRSKHV